jgi:short-subunit dehydrogenase
MIEKSKGRALITGASSGIGALYADRLAKRDYDLILIARNKERLAALSARLEAETGRSVEIIIADLNSREGLAEVEHRLRSDDGITMLVNNAGVGAVAPLIRSDVDQMERMIDLNITALVRLTYAGAPGFVKRRSGTIINMGSAVGITPETVNGVYGATKAFVIAFSLSLHKELAESNVQVQVVLPGAVATDFWALSGKPVEQLPSEVVMQADDMVDAALAGLDLGELITIPSLPNSADWNAYEAARQKMRPQLSRKNPAERYRVAAQKLVGHR